MTKRSKSLRPVQKRRPRETRAHSFDDTTSLRYSTTATTTTASTSKSSSADTEKEYSRERPSIISVDKEDTKKCPEYNNEQSNLTENEPFKRSYTIREKKRLSVSSPQSKQDVVNTSQVRCSEKTANEMEYTAFREELLRDVPDYVHRTHLDMDQKKIYVGVKRGNISEASTFLRGISKELFENGIICIQEVGNLQFAGKKYNLTADQENNRENEGYKTYFGDTLPYIEPGKRLKIIHADGTGSCATLGAIGQDSAGNFYGITAQHLFGHMICEQQVKTYCQFNTTQMTTSCELGDKSYGYFGSKESKGPFHDIAIIPLLKNEQLFHKMSPCFKNDQNKDMNIEVYRDDFSKLKGCHVQQIGATSGNVKGQIIVPRFDFYEDKKWMGSDCFKVAADDGQFGNIGDSGAFITNDLSSISSSLAIAYGMFFLLEDIGTYVSPFEGKEKEYKSVAWCVRLDSGLEILKKKFDITVDLISPAILENFKSKLYVKKCIAPADTKKMASKEKGRSKKFLQRYHSIPGKQKRRKDAARSKTWPIKRHTRPKLQHGEMMQMNADYMDFHL